MNAAHESMMQGKAGASGDILEEAIKSYLDESGYVLVPKSYEAPARFYVGPFSERIDGR